MPVEALLVLKLEGRLGALLRGQRGEKGFRGIRHHGRGMDAGVGGSEQHHSHTDRENPQRSCLHDVPPSGRRTIGQALSLSSPGVFLAYPKRAALAPAARVADRMRSLLSVRVLGFLMAIRL